MFALPPSFAGARPVPDLTPDVEFHLHPTFTLNPARMQPGGPRPVPLPLPAATRRGVLLGSAEAAGAPELGRYYQAVVRAIEGRGLDPREVSARHYFWLRPVLLASRGQALAWFPFCDTYSETAHLLGRLAGTSQGQLLNDQDQGWRLHLFGTASQLYWQQGDDDAWGPAYATDRARLRALAQATLDRIRQQVAALVQQVGADLWGFSGQTEL